ncbi:hypothetical protein [uncultured Algibacter sp.]|uniref:hypothetical protein n=1 Tax=uncultured Algibacter sp. TaxID=298659 RepID=UPI003217FF6C
MKKFTLKKLMSLVVLFASLALVSCGSDDDGANSESNITITDTDGLKIELIWTVENSSNPESDVDLDFEVLDSDGEDVVDASRVDAFESENFLSSLNDGVYRIVIEYFEGSSVASYSLTIRGLNGTDTQTVNGEIGNSGTDDNTTISVITFEKSGDVYTFM